MTATGIIYGLKTASSRVLYVGKTTKSLSERLSNHVRSSRTVFDGNPVLVWIRDVGEAAVLIVELEHGPLDQLNVLEVSWTNTLKTHVSEGGLNRIRGTQLSEADRAQRSASLRQHFQDHPESRVQRSAQLVKRFSNPANREKVRTSVAQHYTKPESHVPVRRGGQLGAHNRWHVNRGVTKVGCEFCV